jgi:hypothetical protein
VVELGRLVALSRRAVDRSQNGLGLELPEMFEPNVDSIAIHPPYVGALAMSCPITVVRFRSLDA